MLKILTDKKLRKLFFTSLIFVGFVLALSFIPAPDKFTQAAIDNEGAGWAWSENIGWMSMNDINPETATDGEYGLDIDFFGQTMSGWVWSGIDAGDGAPAEGMGWICVGATCLDEGNEYGDFPGKGENPPGASIEGTENNDINVSFDENGNFVTGWARIISLAEYEDDIYSSGSSWGWISLADNNASADPDYGLYLNTSTRQVEGWAWSGNGSDASENQVEHTGFGWITFNDVTTGTNVGTITGTVTYLNDEDVRVPIANAIVTARIGNNVVRNVTTNSNGDYVISQLVDGSYSIDGFASGYESMIGASGLSCPSTNISGGSSRECNFSLNFNDTTGVEYQDVVTGHVQDNDENNIVGALVYCSSSVCANSDLNNAAVTDVNGDFVIKWPSDITAINLERDFTAVASGYSRHDQTIILNLPGSNSFPTPFVLQRTGFHTTSGLPWMMTWDADIHSNKAVGSIATSGPPLGFGNATFLITSGDVISGGEIVNFDSWSERYAQDPKTLQDYREFKAESVNGSYADLGFPSDGDDPFSEIPFNQYVDMLISDDETIQYNNTIGGQSFDLQYIPEGNNVLHISEISEPIANEYVAIRGGTLRPGHHTIIAENINVIIRGDMFYESDPLGYLPDDLPSLGIIVRNGNILIVGTSDDPDNIVKHTIGAWYVDGTPDGGATPDGECNDLVVGLSGYYLGTDTGCIETSIYKEDGYHDQSEFPSHSPMQLVHEGLMVARGFAFNRQIDYSIAGNCDDIEINNQIIPTGFSCAAQNSPSEFIFYDGRVVVNPPAGFTDPTSDKPHFQESR
ncbi:MAG: carboxypeptidase-like regulatory domain-containing protein [bacterium]